MNRSSSFLAKWFPLTMTNTCIQIPRVIGAIPKKGLVRLSTVKINAWHSHVCHRNYCTYPSDHGVILEGSRMLISFTKSMALDASLKVITTCKFRNRKQMATGRFELFEGIALVLRTEFSLNQGGLVLHARSSLHIHHHHSKCSPFISYIMTAPHSVTRKASSLPEQHSAY